MVIKNRVILITPVKISLFLGLLYFYKIGLFILLFFLFFQYNKVKTRRYISRFTFFQEVRKNKDIKVKELKDKLNSIDKNIYSELEDKVKKFEAQAVKNIYFNSNYFIQNKKIYFTSKSAVFFAKRYKFIKLYGFFILVKSIEINLNNKNLLKI